MATSSSSSLASELASLLWRDSILPADTRAYLVDATESRACGAAPTRSHYPGAPSPSRWCFDHDLPIIPRGGGTGFTAGSIDFGGVLSNKLSVFIAIVVVLSALLLFAIFRSLVIPL